MIIYYILIFLSIIIYQVHLLMIMFSYVKDLYTTKIFFVRLN